MADTRGGYRAVKVVLLDGPDYQDLSERARHLFLALKLSFGPTGIEVHYPEALAAEMAAKTGIPVEGVRDALDELRADGWVDWERNVFWIVGQLKHEPHFNEANEKHRAAVWSHVGGLPRLGIVRAFIERYSPYFKGAPDSLSNGLPDRPSHSPPKQGVGIRDEGRGITDTSPDGDDGEPSQNEDGTTSLDVADDADWATLRTSLFEPLRKHVWKGKQPPSNVPAKGRRWDEARELSYIRDWVRGGLLEPDEAAEFLRFAPVEMGWKGSASLSWLGRDEHIPRIREIVGRVRKDQMTRISHVPGVLRAS